MAMNTGAHLNLARKWRSKQFDQVIGQDLSIRMLKNSLYLDQIFPVYLFSGQRGCGKTSTARIFAAAVNCYLFEQFKTDPKKAMIPCLSCASCMAMQDGKHPDVIEIDAASHTGVDNVRNIIDAASFLPLLGRKKIYLIDEAHMLSKAAFNALLKILEEPPASVLFILATTDPQKIIDTVRSRCFQLFFNAIDTNILVAHLERICQEEEIQYDRSGLELIVKETDGSARDALNMLESVRFSAATVTKDAVAQVLGHVEESVIISLFEAIVSNDHKRLFSTLQTVVNSDRAIMFVWQGLLKLLQSLLWMKHGIVSESFGSQQQLHRLVSTVDWLRLYEYLQICYKNEQLFLKTTHQRAFLEMLLLQLSLHSNPHEESGSGCISVPGVVSAVLKQERLDAEGESEVEDEQDDEMAHCNSKWKAYIEQMSQAIDDQLLLSIFKQSRCVQFDQVTGRLDIAFQKRFIFFQDRIEATQAVWLPFVKEQFGAQITLHLQFVDVDQESLAKKNAVALLQQPTDIAITKQSLMANGPLQHTNAKASQEKYSSFNNYRKKKQSLPGKELDVHDKQIWQKTHTVLHYFPGTVYELSQVQT